ncbi:MAG: hypothetical protein DME85_09590 [Verrucomicrobia bacterium]|nr:MAG: hypothetical protein DME85_09590 [Verrucomicrobiota bacterium]
MLFYVYVLHSRIDKGLYIGYSTNLRKRLKQHWPISPSRHCIAVPGRSSITRCISNKQTPPGGGSAKKRWRPTAFTDATHTLLHESPGSF